MRKNNFIIFILCVLVIPNFVMAKITCSDGVHSALIDVEKTKLATGESSLIGISASDENSNYQITYNFKNNTEEIVSIGADGIVKGLREGLGSITVEIIFKEDDEEVGNCNSTINYNILSSDSSLSYLSSEEVNFSEFFRKDLLEYSIEVPYKYEKINILATPSEPTSKITGAGRRYLNEGDNIYNIVVTASDGSSTTYTLIITRSKPNNNTELKNLYVEGYSLTPAFSTGIYEYNLEVDKNVDKINITAEADNILSSVLGKGEKELASGDNTFYVYVVSESNEKQKYTINVTRAVSKLKLQTLNVEGYNLKFEPDTYTYNLIVGSNVNSLEINAKSLDNKQIDIEGNNNLKVGSNVITIRINDDEEAATYKIFVDKLSEEEEKAIEDHKYFVKVLLIVLILLVAGLLILIILYSDKKVREKERIKNFKKIDIRRS